MVLLKIKKIAAKKTILVVDDEPLIVDFLKAYLAHHDFNVLTADCGQQALETLASKAVDLIITDQSMPEMSGIELSQAAKKLYPDLRIILSSGYNEDINELNIEHYGIDSFCAKPASCKELIKKVHTLLSLD